MKFIECPECEGRGAILDWPGHPCDLCRGTGQIPADWIPPEEPPPHTDADAPHDAEPTVVYCPVCLHETARCTCEAEIDENALREALGRF